MNPKLIIASLTGVGILGGGVTGCYYYCEQKASEKQKTTTSHEESTNKVANAQSSEILGTQNPPSQPSSISADSPQKSTVVTQPSTIAGQETAKAPEGAGGPSALLGAV